MSETVPVAWLTERWTVPRAEMDSIQKIRTMKRQYPGIEIPEVPFGELNAKWRDLVDSMLVGDELWAFESAPETWPEQGRVGYVVTRAGMVVASLISAAPAG
jgi:hypothetical protein